MTHGLQRADGPDGAIGQVEEVRVESWAELNERLFEGSWQEPLRRHRSRMAFHGVREPFVDELVTSLARLGDGYERSERHALRNFRKFAGPSAASGDSTWHWLALGQHHGLPTRLLDWTFSPYVAMHFATAEPARYHTDGVIWAVDYVAVHERVPAPLRRRLEDEEADVFTVEMLADATHTLDDFDALSDEPFVVFIDPPSLDDRIINQFALFSCMSGARHSLATWLGQHAGLARRIVVPADLNWEVRDKLDQANITERVLFPGLDGLSQWLKRYYTVRG